MKYYIGIIAAVVLLAAFAEFTFVFRTVINTNISLDTMLLIVGLAVLITACISSVVVLLVKKKSFIQGYAKKERDFLVESYHKLPLILTKEEVKIIDTCPLETKGDGFYYIVSYVNTAVDETGKEILGRIIPKKPIEIKQNMYYEINGGDIIAEKRYLAAS